MAITAVAGGTGQLGRAIVEELINHGGHQVLILSREANEAKEKEIGARILAIDYNDTKAIAATLEDYKIDTVISTLSSMIGTQPEISLINAADRSKTTKRFIPSAWAIRYTPEMADFFPVAKAKVEYFEALKSTNLEYTVVMNGLFLDYFGQPHIKTYLPSLIVAIDVANNVAGIPASGNIPVAFTYSFDVGRFVAALLSLPTWEKEFYAIGDKVTWNEFLEIVEEVKGVKFDVKYDSLDALKRGEVTELPGQRAMYAYFPKEHLQGFLALFGVFFEQGEFDFKPKNNESLNELFPNIKPKSVRDLVEEAWRGK